MSTLASKVRARERHRMAVARGLAAFECRQRPTDEDYLGGDEGWPAWAAELLAAGRMTFDVHAAREHARTLIGKGLDLTTGPEHDVWTDWRAWWAGKGRTPDECPATASGQGGQYARMGQRIIDMLEAQASECAECHGRQVSTRLAEWVVSELRNGQRRQFKFDDPADARIADAWASGDSPPCEDCHGTGHNLRGKLPGVEWSPAVRRKVRDAELGRAEVNQQRDSWTFPILDSIGPGKPRALVRWCDKRNGPLHTFKTRVCPRGEHGDPGVYAEPSFLLTIAPADRPTLDERISSRAMFHELLDSPVFDTHPTYRLPSWRRGEIEHARHRREREARRVEVVVEGGDDDAVETALFDQYGDDPRGAHSSW